MTTRNRRLQLLRPSFNSCRMLFLVCFTLLVISRFSGSTDAFSLSPPPPRPLHTTGATSRTWVVMGPDGQRSTGSGMINNVGLRSLSLSLSAGDNEDDKNNKNNNNSGLTLTASEQGVYDCLQKLHESGYTFRIIVVGNQQGAILETTATLGPAFKLNTSPKTGNMLLTMATVDQSFEFHVTLAQVKQLQLVERPVPAKPDGTPASAIRVLRFLNPSDEAVCTLLLSDKSDDAVSFFGTLMETYGPNHVFGG